ncbi:MAG: glucosaminidase domain-containing protein, partial [Candidatus Gastranaerophilales bacterium]|nr:glucosaminidase domain-containing protein [Candidatus Gastranaerophilales bacterium]
NSNRRRTLLNARTTSYRNSYIPHYQTTPSCTSSGVCGSYASEGGNNFFKRFASSAGKTAGNIIRGISSTAGKVFSAGKEAVTKFTGNTGNLVNKLNGKLKGRLKGQGAAIVSAALRSGINPALFASIVAFESGWGKFGSGNNFAGIMKGGRKRQFASVEEGLNAAASNLRRNYYNKGRTTPQTIGPKYCPVGAGNDKYGTNNQWIPSVTSIFNRLMK